MKKLILIFLLSITCTVFAFSQAATWSLEPFIGFGIETEEGMPGMEYGFQTSYSVTDRFGWQSSLGSFQALNFKSFFIENASYMLFSVNIFGDLLKTAKGHTIRLSAGGTYFLGALTYFSSYVDDIPVVDDANLDKYNNIGLNAKLSYLCPLTDRWHLGINLNGYDILDGKFLQIISLGCSVGYKF